MFKKILILSVSFGLLLSIGPVFAGRPSNVPNPPADLPEQAGVYDVPGHPELKLRVFVHPGKPDNPGKGKPDKPGKPTPPPPEPNCTLTDPGSSFVVHGAGWKLPAGTWEYNLNLRGVPEYVGADNLSVIAENAFGKWLAAVDNAVSVAPGAEATTDKAQYDTQNIISWGRAPGNALAVSYIWYRTDTTPYTAVEVDTIMNKKFNWAWSDPSGWEGEVCAYEGVYDAQNILTHELGHTFGLDDEYSVDYQHNTMFGYGAVTETKKNTLTTGDIAGVQALYK